MRHRGSTLAITQDAIMLEVAVSARSIFTSAVVALVVVIAYDQYKIRRG